MERRLKSDLLRTSLLAASLICFPLFLQPNPPPEGLQVMSSWQVIPVNMELSERYYGLALTALETREVSLNKAYVAAAIYFDPEAFSSRYTEYQRAREQITRP